MTASAPSLETGTAPTGLARATDPFHNPAYPRRTHFLERASLEEALRSCDERLNQAFQKLNVLAGHGQKPVFVRLYQQMQGARDQVAEAARRMPLEVGGLYHEDHERFEQAMEAIDRTWRRWQATGG